MIYSNFHTTFWYTPIAERGELSPARFLLKTLPYKTYSLMTSQQVLPEGSISLDLHETILEQAIVSSENISNIPLDSSWYSILPLDLRNELLEVIVSSSIPNQKFFETLDLTLELAIDSKFQGNDWNCKNCQARKLDYQRNCPFLPEEEHEDTFSIQVADTMYRVCPMNLSDNNILQQAFEARSIRESGSLPEEGPVGSQSVFHIIASQKVINKIEYHKNKQLSEAHNN